MDAEYIQAVKDAYENGQYVPGDSGEGQEIPGQSPG